MVEAPKKAELNIVGPFSVMKIGIKSNADSKLTIATSERRHMKAVTVIALRWPLAFEPIPVQVKIELKSRKKDDSKTPMLAIVMASFSDSIGGKYGSKMTAETVEARPPKRIAQPIMSTLVSPERRNDFVDNAATEMLIPKTKS
jgi:hypothetical protein